MLFFNVVNLTKSEKYPVILYIVGCNLFATSMFQELMPDTSIESPEEAVMKQHMKRDMHDLLNDLEPREKQVLTLRFGLNDHQPRSLEDIGRLFRVSKEWVRRIEKKALTKLQNEASNLNLSNYLDL